MTSIVRTCITKLVLHMNDANPLNLTESLFVLRVAAGYMPMSSSVAKVSRESSFLIPKLVQTFHCACQRDQKKVARYDAYDIRHGELCLAACPFYNKVKTLSNV